MQQRQKVLEPSKPDFGAQPHNPEIAGSNPVLATKIPPKSVDSGGIPLVFLIFLETLFLQFFVDPHRDPHAEMPGEGQRVPDRKFRLPAWLFSAFSALHDLRHKIPHRLRCPILLLSGGVGVGTEGKSCVVVSKHTADRFHIYTVLEGQGGECVPLPLTPL